MFDGGRADDRLARVAGLVAIQWLPTLAFALTVRHNGWLYYQGGDQIWYYDRLAARARLLPPTSSATAGPSSLAPITLVAGRTTSAAAAGDRA